MNTISIEELKKLNNVNIVDIRDSNKYQIKHLENAINLTFNNLLLNTDKYLDKNKCYYIYCYTGKISSNLCNILRKNGYNVISVIGGI